MLLGWGESLGRRLSVRDGEFNGMGWNVEREGDWKSGDKLGGEFNEDIHECLWRCA